MCPDTTVGAALATSVGMGLVSKEPEPESCEWSSGTPISTAASNSLRTCRQSGHSARCACRSSCSSSVRSPEVEMAQSSRNLLCGPISGQPWLSRLSVLFSMPFVYRNTIPKHLLPQLIQPTVIVVPHISQGLPHFLADLRQVITIEEVQAQGFTLIFRQSL